MTVTPLSCAQMEQESKIYPGSILRVEDNRPQENSFTTSYRIENPIEKTVVFPALHEGPDGKPLCVQIRVHMRSGDVYSFACWSTRWCGDCGIQVSNDGKRIYMTSDILGKGLCCCEPEGNMVWKTRYTSVTDVVPHADGSVTALTYNGSIYKIEADGTVSAKKKAFDGRPAKLVSADLISVFTGDYTLSFLNVFSLGPAFKLSLKPLELEALDCVAIDQTHILLCGQKQAQMIPLPSGKFRGIYHPVMYVLHRESKKVLKLFDEEYLFTYGIAYPEANMFAARARLEDEKIILFPGAMDGRSFRKIEISL